MDVIAHELSHSWSGNLVTNASWEHFWLNEGWTTYLERRVCITDLSPPYLFFPSSSVYFLLTISKDPSCNVSVFKRLLEDIC